MKTFFVSHEGEQMGPWGSEEILSKLKTHALGWSDYIYDEGKEDWIFIMDHAEFNEQFKAEKPASAPGAEVQAITPPHAGAKADMPGDKEWFVLKAENRYGPFAFLEVVRMLQEKNLYEFDYIWNPSMAHWARVAEVEEFKPEKIRALKESGTTDVQEIFFRRRHARVKYGCSIIIHNNKRVWKGESLELSSGGAGMKIEHSDFQPGQTLFLHFKPGDGVPPFNAICTIVSKQTKGQAGIHYGVKFTSINRTVQAAIKDYTDKAA